LIDTLEVDDENFMRKYSVMGSIGNVYEVNIKKLPSCTCPDFGNGNICKHILFIYLKVLKVEKNSYLIYQKALLTTELQDIFYQAPKDPKGVYASKQVRDKYNEIMGRDVENTKPEESQIKQKVPGPDDLCPICYENMTTEEALVYCKTGCGNSLHQDCFSQWDGVQQKKNLPTTCVYCRSEWVSEGGKKKES